MVEKDTNKLIESYCYGPVDLLQIRKGDSTMWLTLRDPVGRKARAVYHNCVYWRLDEKQTGVHLSLVQRVTAQELLQRKGSVTLRALHKNSSDVSRLLMDWEAEGLSFYLHLGIQPEMEFLVVASSMEYREKDAK